MVRVWILSGPDILVLDPDPIAVEVVAITDLIFPLATLSI